MDLNYWKLLLARVWKMDIFDSDGFKGGGGWKLVFWFLTLTCPHYIFILKEEALKVHVYRSCWRYRKY